eukprot:TRINITY_DN58636_c0_g1_i1.p1 TRINITY_DN58636_c0_g1~~TRINITY_DN58636_c0_g1_i1.p1  ORF type:complete len:751 (+),score=127.77 TRINITY_DN58636_c0_g1_i1:37-2289(+)
MSAKASPTPAMTVESLQDALLIKDDELRTWRIRALQAEAEVRALKRGTKHTSVPSSPRGRSPTIDLNDGATPEPVSPLPTRRVQKSEASIQTDRPKPASPPRITTPAKEESSARSPNSGLSELEELQQQLQLKSFTILQLQADNVREQQQREKQSAEKQRRAAESQQMCREELKEMTQRAESLSEQFRKSKKRASELQAARDTARESCASAMASFEECEARLFGETSAHRELHTEHHNLEARLWSLRASQANDARKQEEWKQESQAASSEQHQMLEERLSALVYEVEVAQHQNQEVTTELAAAQADVNTGAEARGGLAEAQEAWSTRQSKLVECLNLLRQLHTELHGSFRHKPQASQARGAPVVSRIMHQLETAQKLVEPPLTAAVGRHRALSPLGAVRGSSPEAERPAPESAADSAMALKLDINEVRVAAEQAREKLISEHCDELDDLVRRHDQERKKMHREVNELRSELKAEAKSAAARPGLHFREYFDSQVAPLKQELVAQLADLQERRQLGQHNPDEQEMLDLRRSLERCQSELFSSQFEFATLAMLYDKEQRENQRLRQHQRRESRNSDTVNAGPGTPDANEVANITTIASSVHDHDVSPETTLAADTLPMAILAAAASRATEPEDAQSIPAALPAPSSAVKSVALKMPMKSMDEAQLPKSVPPKILPSQAQMTAWSVAGSTLRTALPLAQSRGAHSHVSSPAGNPGMPIVVNTAGLRSLGRSATVLPCGAISSPRALSGTASSR